MAVRGQRESRKGPKCICRMEGGVVDFLLAHDDDTLVDGADTASRNDDFLDREIGGIARARRDRGDHRDGQESVGHSIGTPA